MTGPLFRPPYLALLSLLVLAAPLARAATEKSVAEILECQLRTRPLTNSVRSIELISRDRSGRERSQRAKLYGGRSREGFRTLLIRFTHPEDIRDLSVLITERRGANHIFVSPAGLPDVRQIKGAQGRNSLFGSDFSYEDVQRLYGLSQPGETRRVADGAESAWLLETTPAAENGSGYSRIVSHVDRETCVLLRAEMFEAGEEPRKVFTADPDSVSKEGSVFVAHELLLRDLRDGTQTRLIVDEIELEVDQSGIPFSPEALAESKRGVAP